METSDVLRVFALGTLLWLGHWPVLWVACKVMGWL